MRRRPIPASAARPRQRTTSSSASCSSTRPGFAAAIRPPTTRSQSAATLRMENPVMESQDKDTGAINCSGSLSLDLPPGVAADGGRTTLMSDIDYTIENAATAAATSSCCAMPTGSSRRSRRYRGRSSRRGRPLRMTRRVRPTTGTIRPTCPRLSRSRSSRSRQPRLLRVERGQASTVRPRIPEARSRSAPTPAWRRSTGDDGTIPAARCRTRRPTSRRCSDARASGSSPIATAVRTGHASATPMSEECARSATSWTGSIGSRLARRPDRWG